MNLYLAFITAWLQSFAAPDGFRPPRFDPASDIAQGGTGREERR